MEAPGIRRQRPGRAEHRKRFVVGRRAPVGQASPGDGVPSVEAADRAWNANESADVILQALPLELRVVARAGDAGLIADLVRQVDWDITLALARYHRVSGILAATLRRARLLPMLPIGTQRALDDELRDRGDQYRHGVLPQLAELVRELTASGAEPVLLKGAALTARGLLPGDVRPMADLDLLIEPQALEVAGSALTRLGYETRTNAASVAWARANHYQDPPRFHNRHPLPVDLHWNLQRPTHRHAFPLASLRTQTIRSNGTHYRFLVPADQLTHLCVHFWNDREKQHNGAIGQLHDIDTVARWLAPPDWAELIDASARRGHHDVVAAALAAAALIVGTPVDHWPSVGESANDERLRSFVLRRVVAPRPDAIQLLMVTPDVAYRWPRIARRVTAQLRRSPVADVTDRQHRRMVLRLLMWLATHPLDVRSEVELDRWAHDLA